MLRPFHPLDFLALDAMLGAFQTEVPEVGNLRDAVFASPDRLWVWPGEGGLRGFAFLPGDAIRVLTALYTKDPADRQALLDAAIAPLQLSSDVAALMAPERLGEVSLAEGLATLGFQRIERIDMVQELSRVPPAPVEVPEPFRLCDWDPARDPEAAVLLSRSNQGTIDGLFLCFPDLPDPAACLKRLSAIREGQFGEFLPDVSGMVLEGDRLVGLLLATRSGPKEVFLYELALRKEVQNRGLAPVLIRRLQEATRARGLEGIRFMWCDFNRSVRKLFPPASIMAESRDAWWVWRSEAYRASRRKAAEAPAGS